VVDTIDVICFIMFLQSQLRLFQEQILSGPSIDGSSALSRFFCATGFYKYLLDPESGFETDTLIEEVYSKTN